MANNRYLEIIKRMLSAETYLRSRKDADEHEPHHPGITEKRPQ